MPNFHMTVELVDELKSAPRLCVCRQCGGEGAQRSTCPFEEERGIMDACYHCLNTGRVDEETDFADRIVALAGMQAQRTIECWVRKDEEGDFDLMAAESGLDRGAYKRLLIDDEIQRTVPELAARPRHELEALFIEEGV